MLTSFLSDWFGIMLCGADFLALLWVCLFWWAFPFIIFMFLILAFSFPLRRSSLSICYKADLVMWNSLSFFLSINHLIFPSDVNERLAG